MLLVLPPTAFNHTEILATWKFTFLNRMNGSGDRYLIFLNSRVFDITMRWYVCVIWAQPIGESPCLNESLHWPATVKSNGGIDERLCRTDVRYYNFISSEKFQVKLICYVRCSPSTPSPPTYYLPTEPINELQLITIRWNCFQNLQSLHTDDTVRNGKPRAYKPRVSTIIHHWFVTRLAKRSNATNSSDAITHSFHNRISLNWKVR